MNRLIKGSGMVAELLVSGDYVPIFCAKDCTLSVSQDEIEVTSINSGSSREYLPGMANGMLTVGGLSPIDNTEGKISIFYLLQQGIRQSVKDWRVTFTADDGTGIAATFKGFIRSDEISKQGFAYTQSSTQIRITGNISLGEIVDPPAFNYDILSDYWTTTNGVNYVSLSAASAVSAYIFGATDSILQVDVEGTQFDVITTGSPGNRECKLNTMTYVLTFATDFLFDGTQRVYVMFKRS